jgi:hypothetical protein
MKSTLTIFLIALSVSVRATVYERYTTGSPNDVQSCYGFANPGQSFTVGTTSTNEEHTLQSITIYVSKVGSPGTMTIHFRAASSGLPTGSDLSTGTFDGNALSTSASTVTVDMTTFDLQPSTQYCFHITGGSDAENMVRVYSYYDALGGPYSGGGMFFAGGSLYTTTDLYFEINGVSTALPAPHSYNPIAGKHVRFFADGIEKKDKPRPPDSSSVYFKIKTVDSSGDTYTGNPYADGVNVLYVDLPVSDGGVGSASNNGLSTETPVTVLEVEGMYASFDTIAFADGTHRGCLQLDNWSGTLGTYHKYGNPKAVLSGYKVLGSLTNSSGNIYTITDTDLPSVDYGGTVIREITGAGVATHAIPTYNYLLRDGKPFASGRYPASGFLNTTNADASNPPTYFDDTETTFASGYWTGAYINWSNNGARKWDMQRAVASYNGSRYTFTTTMDLSGIIESERDNTNYFLSNHPNACTSNGEWYYYPGTHVLGVYENAGTSGHTYEFNKEEFVLFLNTCTNTVIENIEFQGGLEATVMVNQGSNVYFDSCAIKYAGVYGIDAYSVDDFAYNDGSIEYTSGTGIFLEACNGEEVKRNTISNIASDYAMISNMGMGNAGVVSYGRYGTSDISYNTIDNIGYNAIHFYGQVSSGVATSKGNAITRFCQRTSDGGAYYVNGDNVSKTGNSQIIRNNYISDAVSDEYIGTVQDAWGVYQDGYGEGTWADSNAITETSGAVFIHNVRRMTIKNNIMYDNFNSNVNYARTSILHTQQAWTTGYGIQLVRNNITIARDSLETGYLFVWDGTLDYAYNDVDSNKHYNPFLANVNASVATTYPLNYRSISYFTSSPFSWMENSTFNSPDWTYQDVTGITRNQFVRIYYNHSATPHTFDLGGLTLKSIPSGTNVSSTITLQPYKSAVYFYVSGSFTGADDTYYNP